MTPPPPITPPLQITPPGPTPPPLTPSFEAALADANLAFTSLFCLELAAKLVGLGPWTYFTDYWNMFDALVVGFRWGVTGGGGEGGNKAEGDMSRARLYPAKTARATLSQQNLIV
jgi:hypothetical protein